MHKKTLPIGSIIRVADKEAMIAGYTFLEKDGHMANHYLIVPFPVGFTDEDSYRTLDADRVQLISEGYASEASGMITKFIDDMMSVSDQIPYAEMMRYMEEAGSGIEEGE